MVIVLNVKLDYLLLLVVQTFMFQQMFLDTIILLVRNENCPKANLHVTKENKALNKKKLCKGLIKLNEGSEESLLQTD